MFCWVYVKDTSELWLLREGQWLVYTCEPSQIGQMFADTVEQMHQFNYHAAKGWGYGRASCFVSAEIGSREGTIH